MVLKKIAFFALFIFLILGTRSYAGELVAKEAMNYYNEGVQAQKKGSLETAISAYHKALLLGVKDIKYEKFILNNLGVVYAQNGDLENAKVALNEALSIDPNYESAMLNLGLIYDKEPDKVKAIEYWLKVFDKIKPKDFIVEEQQKTKNK
jgi:tetratricopeptide (TPR) repeat protein